MTLNDKVLSGEVMVVRVPHRFKPKLYTYTSVEAAMLDWLDNAIYHEYANFNEFENEFDGDDALIEFTKEKLEEKGIGLDQPFAEFAPTVNIDVDVIPLPCDKMDLLKEMVEGDMYSSHVFIAEDGTYLDFVDEICRFTRGHNEPSMREICNKLFIDVVNTDFDSFKAILLDYDDNGEDFPDWKLLTPYQRKTVKETLALIKQSGEYRDEFDFIEEVYEVIENNLAQFKEW